MKKGTKIGLGIGGLLFGALLLSGCTNSFCSTVDKAHILYGIDHGVCEYFATEEEANTAKGESETTLVGQVPDTTIYYAAKFENCGNLNKIKNAAAKSGISVPSLKYYVAYDHVVLEHAIQQKALDDTSKTADQMYYLASFLSTNSPVETSNASRDLLLIMNQITPTATATPAMMPMIIPMIFFF